ncbi:MAG: hypothetical protein MHM6MM_005899 [Cercozoa sp. M6MM]
MERIRLSAGVVQAVDDYAFKRGKHVAAKNRLYVSWRNSVGVECRVIGPESRCFCGHKYREHASENFEDKNVHCNVEKCRCRLFEYVPT